MLKTMRAALILFALTLGVGCVQMPDMPRSREVDASKAADLVMQSWGRSVPAPRVFVIEDDGCAGPNNTGFVSPFPGQGCVGGLTMRKSDGYDEPRVYLVRPFDGKLSWDRCFVHELAHWVGYDHAIPGTWSDASDVGSMINQGNALLWLNPDVDLLTE